MNKTTSSTETNMNNDINNESLNSETLAGISGYTHGRNDAQDCYCHDGRILRDSLMDDGKSFDYAQAYWAGYCNGWQKETQMMEKNLFLNSK